MRQGLRLNCTKLEHLRPGGLLSVVATGFGQGREVSRNPRRYRRFRGLLSEPVLVFGMGCIYALFWPFGVKRPALVLKIFIKVMPIWCKMQNSDLLKCTRVVYIKSSC